MIAATLLVWLVALAAIMSRAPMGTSAIRSALAGGALQWAAAVTVLCAVFAWPAASGLAVLRSRWGLRLATVVLAVLWLAILAGSAAWFAGLPHAAPPSRGTRWLACLAIVDAVLPLVAMPLLGAMRHVDAGLLRAAASLGASPAQRFWRVTVPMAAPCLFAAGLAAFLLVAAFLATSGIGDGAALSSRAAEVLGEYLPPDEVGVGMLLLALPVAGLVLGVAGRLRRK